MSHYVPYYYAGSKIMRQAVSVISDSPELRSGAAAPFLHNWVNSEFLAALVLNDPVLP